MLEKIADAVVRELIRHFVVLAFQQFRQRLAQWLKRWKEARKRFLDPQIPPMLPCPV